MDDALPDRRERILDAAVDLLQTQGLHRLTQPQVAKHAAVTQSHLTYYFPRRTDLLAAVAQRYVASLAAELVAQEPGDLDGLLDFAARLVHDRKRTRMLVGLLVEAEEDAALHDQLVQSAAMMRAAVAEVAGLPPEDPALYILQATVWGLAVQFLLIGPDQPYLATRELLRTFRSLTQFSLHTPDRPLQPDEPPPHRRRRP
jgi:AcrR family transcriptional regulator